MRLETLDIESDKALAQKQLPWGDKEPLQRK
jgi:hypothetical protein